ncbi:zinc-dependent peptidase [Microbulbifer sp. OS29]|uniref:Zinc-dependent peptidase n=1 Tax=Microbulbifer okhotskensis TaxID=2926617 RepID=A0A9X2ENR7_9GAMM|nr:zinc-dependent peptidase [Microbulbifer okhotskensis]MCO1335034.1 zinc-dependent peptidase [Microbulbifer okhotskensis]
MSAFIAIILLALTIWLVPHFYHRWRISYLRSQALNREQLQLLQETLPLYHHLNANQQQELRGNIALFLHDKEFVGCDGLQVNERMKVVIAAHACLLLLGRKNECYPNLYSLLLYPNTYVAHEIRREGYIETARPSARAGEAHYRGPVVLSWGDLEGNLQSPEQGHNVALHEFAHKVDEEDGYFDGRPLFESTEEGATWAAVMSREFRRLRQRAEFGEFPGASPSVLDLYGAQSPAEFFAVATESFYMIPIATRTLHPELYKELSHFYRLDPAALINASSNTA